MATQNAQKSLTYDVVIVGAGPATLGLLTNAVKTNRLSQLMDGDGIAVIESGLSFGAGCLANFGLNSNTSANGFLKCLYKKVTVAEPKKLDQQTMLQIQNKIKLLPEGSPERKKLKDMLKCGLDEGNDSSDDGEEGTGPAPKNTRDEYQAL
jgi:hypothetical protein